MVTNQSYLFLVFILNGIFIGLIFDFFRILRKSFKTTNFITNIEDILFWIFSGISIIFCMYKFSEGSLRLFMFLGLGFGIVIYMIILSKIIINVSVKIIIILKKIIYKFVILVIIPIKYLIILFDKFIFRPIYLFSVKIKNKLTIKSKKIKYKTKKIEN